MNKKVIDIEETQKFVELGIIVLNDGKRKYYVKPRATKNPNFPFELVPLTNKEKAKLGIEESVGESEDSEIEIEESEGESETERKFQEDKKRAEAYKKEHKVDMNDAESVKNAQDILDKQLKKLKGDSENEELRNENEDLKGKLGIIAEKALADKKKKLGLDPNNLMSPEEVMGFEKGLESASSGKAPSGSAPLNDAQMGSGGNVDLASRKFSSHAELVKFLKANESDPEARKYIEALWKQTIKAMKAGQKIEYNLSQDLKSESSQPVELRLSGAERNDPDSELQQFLERGNRKYREQMRLQSERFFASELKKHELSNKKRESEQK